MHKDKLKNFLHELIHQFPDDWLALTTHRLDIYNEQKAKVAFLDELQALFESSDATSSSLADLPTAYDYIRLGHPLSSVLEWALASHCNMNPQAVISFDSQTMPILAVLRKNLFLGKKSLILHTEPLPDNLDLEAIRKVYGYEVTSKQIDTTEDIPSFDGSRIYYSVSKHVKFQDPIVGIDFEIKYIQNLGSVIFTFDDEYIGEIQHVRRRESIAMTPANCLHALRQLLDLPAPIENEADQAENLFSVVASIKEITASETAPLLGSSGLSVQYAIMMGLVEHALNQYPGKAIKFIVPPNCYGGTNDQARRLAACHPQVEIVDLLVDGDADMVQGVDHILDELALQDAVPYIIAEIPTNPRVEVPDLEMLRDALQKKRFSPSGGAAIPPVFILDQTFCPNVQFLSEEGVLADTQLIAYVSGSKFPSGGKATAGYLSANRKAQPIMPLIKRHLLLCDNAATPLQVNILAEQLPSMLDRIDRAYHNTKEFVAYIRKKLPEAKINFVPNEVVAQGFTPSVFSLDLPTKGKTLEEREAYKRQLNHRLIDLMITRIPTESKYCVSYGQLKGCYWTIPATSTQGTTREEDKDYIARVSVSPSLDLERHKAVFDEFVESIHG
ncbi:MAG: cystathionine beta-synthase [Cyclobacteriaceae bacterium]|nr:cystathionine beta-synthase [Cyclobacteriaceae bacterium]MCH8517551.1 cystathionine beta-synthase [Cyclobacteriaceae bacterium]